MTVRAKNSMNVDAPSLKVPSLPFNAPLDMQETLGKGKIFNPFIRIFNPPIPPFGRFSDFFKPVISFPVLHTDSKEIVSHSFNLK